MTKKYRLIREYPGSPKLGLEIKQNGMFWESEFTTKNVQHFHEKFNPEDYPEYWEKIIEKDYEIISWYFGDMNITKYPDGSAREYFIHSVKRLSDGEIFTIGDKVRLIFNKASIVKIINKIAFEKIGCQPEGLYIYTEGEQSTINNYVKAKQPLFTTEDGVEIFEGDNLFSVEKGFYLMQQIRASESITTLFKGRLFFSAREKAEEYILMNKPCLSLNNVLEIYKTANISISKYKSKKNKKQNHNKEDIFIDLLKEKVVVLCKKK